MKHIIRLSNPVERAATTSTGAYIVLAGQILAILAGLFDGKEVLKPDAQAED
ncbi:MAG TPA: hypothetical protein PLZ53_09285 [Candidatus Hydrogenedentes bacterium]|jgi:hypothetical protein|nr:MAG: hypothetical protein BWY07_00915 [Candidatus Hydrogenedentes bacterium ADurb.Bin170]HNZ49474.1 hypothetical protein [Candidatus Hydrogenedentota bacterium]HOD95486.1 hypothetical protein [Candidatus Hydrogenedentota bacterium]HOH43302.1 hypothetical protein [Candidatus Hydrogenedentota bacterium]HOM49596.1 hypothetical protein [Candidatus Hydrogenedentota bacterium]